MRKIIDLTMTLEEGMTTFWGEWHPKVEIEQMGFHEKVNRETRRLTIGTHTGTHMDAPRHFIEEGETIENIPLDVLVGPAYVVDLSDSLEFEEVDTQKLSSRIDTDNIERLIVRFDWDLKLDSEDYYFNHPFFSEDACQWMVDNGCKVLALDTPQPDNPKNCKGAEKDAPNHKILLSKGVALVEYLVNIRSIGSKEVDLVVAPLKIKDGDGSPVRCFVIEE